MQGKAEEPPCPASLGALWLNLACAGPSSREQISVYHLDRSANARARDVIRQGAQSLQFYGHEPASHLR
jgi:hypothetical protein